MTDANRIYAPWSDVQVATLNQYQHSGAFHPFTCANRSYDTHLGRPGEDLGQLVATKDGWVCLDCGYTQEWAHGFMGDSDFIESHRAFRENLFGGGE